MAVRITIILNGKATNYPKNTSIAEALIAYPLPNNFALAVNDNFVAKSEYRHYLLKTGDKLDIFSPIVGG